MRLKNIIWKTVVMSLMASPLCISCDDDDEVTMNSKFYLSTKVFPVDSYEASLSVISPVDYCKLYRERYMPQKERSLALGAKVTYLIPPTGKYAALGKNALVDGLFGGATFVDSWIGWEGTDGAFVIDLGETKEIQSVETDFLHQIGAWILFPLKVVYSYAEDGEHYTHWKTIDLPEERTGEVKFRGVKAESAEPIKTRYVKVEVTGTKECPTWHYGVGHPSWFFIDEVIIK